MTDGSRGFRKPGAGPGDDPDTNTTTGPIMHIALIFNPKSGGGRQRDAAVAVIDGLRRNGARVMTMVSKCPGHCRALAERLSAASLDAVACLGGDGTLSEVVDGLLADAGAAPRPPVAVLPLGRGNSFARDLGIHSLSEGVQALTAGAVRPVDVCRYTQGDGVRHFVNLMGAGFVTDVARTALNFARLGDASYIIGVIYRTVALTHHWMSLTIDGVDYSGPNCFVAFCNSCYTGGAMMMAPGARIDDGRFDAVIVSPLSRLSLLRTFPRIYAGTHGAHPAVTIVRGRHATLRTQPVKALLPDGEVTGTTPTTIDVLPHRLRFFAVTPTAR